MEPSIYRYVVRHSLRQQIALVSLALCSFPFLYLFYELPKRIVNGAIDADPSSFPVAVAGLSFDRIGYLALLSGLFLGLVIVNQAFKYAINVYKGLTAERMLRRLRFDLYGRVLRFPLTSFRRIGAGEIIPMITSEVKSLSGFVGEAFALPVFQGGTLLVVLGFLFVQSPVMAAAAVALYPFQILVIPYLQRRINALAKERVGTVRQLAHRVGETVAGIAEIRGGGGGDRERADFAARLHVIFEIRYAIYFRKFLVKFINNFAQHLGPFFFYSIGGYLVIEGRLDLGTLIAALGAHKDLAAPWRELLAFYQQKEDARIKYLQVARQFAPAELAPERPEDGPEAAALGLSGALLGDIEASSVTAADEFGRPAIEDLSLVIRRGERVAILGDDASRAGDLMLLLAGLELAEKGRVTINGRNLAEAPLSALGRRVGFVGPDTYLFSGTLGDNLFYGVRSRRPDPANGGRRNRRMRREAERTGNLYVEADADWTDYEAAGVTDEAGLVRAGLKLLSEAGMGREVYRLGLEETIDPGAEPDLAAAALALRVRLKDRFADPALEPLVQFLDPARYNENATLAENLLFGAPLDGALETSALARRAYVGRVLDQAGLTPRLLEIGHVVAGVLIDLFEGLPEGHPFFEKFSFLDPAMLPEYERLLRRLPRDAAADASGEDRVLLLGLPFGLIAARHRFGVVDEDLQRRVVLARRLFRSGLPPDLKGRIAFFEPDAFIAPASIAENILFGKIAHGAPGAALRVAALIAEMVEEAGLAPRIEAIGLHHEVGIGGARLSAASRQRLALARALLKRPDALLLSDPFGALDAAEEASLAALVFERARERGATVVWRTGREAFATRFERVIRMRAGRVVENGAAAAGEEAR